jgi:hypothetical protein
VTALLNLKENKMAKEDNQIAEAIQNIADELSYHRLESSEFNGYTIGDSLGFIADAMVRIAEAMEEANKRK